MENSTLGNNSQCGLGNNGHDLPNTDQQPEGTQGSSQDFYAVSPMITPNKFVERSEDPDDDSEDQYGTLLDDENSAEMLECSSLLKLAKDLTKEMFVNRILLDYEQSEPKLDGLRIQLFESLKSDEQFPFGSECDLKRRLNTRNGDSACVKLAYDIHSLVTVIDGADFSTLKDIISYSRKQPRPSSVSKPISRSQTSQDKCSCGPELSYLKDTLSNLQAEILLMKQRQAAAENIRKTDTDTLSTSVTNLSEELNGIRQTLKTSLGELEQQISSVNISSQKNVSKCKTFVTNNSKTILEIQSSLFNFKTAISDISNKLEGSTLSVPSDLNPAPILCTTQADTRAVHMVDAGVQCDLLTVPADDHRTMPTFAQAVATDSEQPENLIDLDYVANPQTEAYTASLVTIENTEDASHFGNSKIPTILTNPARRKNGGRRQRQRQRAVNFAIIRNEIEQAAEKRDRPEQNTRSEYHPVDNDEDDFDQYVRKRTKRYYVSGFLPTITETKIAQYVKERDLKVTKVSIFRKTRNNRLHVVIRVNVEDDGNTDVMTDDPYFWPRGVTCRPWLSPYELRQQRANNLFNRNDDYGDYDHRYDQHIDQYDYERDYYNHNRYSVLQTEGSAVD